MQNKKRVPALKFRRSIFYTIFTVTVFRVLFILTFPLESSSDGLVYLDMLIKGKSSLIHPGGYPWIMNIFYNLGLFSGPNSLLVFQHFISIVFLSFLAIYLKKRFGYLVAIISIALLNLDLTIIEKISLSRPEWLQSLLIISTFIFAYEANIQKNKYKKTLLYAAASTGLIFAYLVKFNSLFLAPILFILILKEKKNKVRYLISIIPLPLIIYNLFIYSFHLSSTGTKDITLEKSYILFQKIYSFSKGPSADYGAWSKRYKIIENNLPNVLRPYHYNHWNIDTMFSHIDMIPPEARMEQKKLYNALRATAEEELDIIIDNIGPEKLNKSRSIIDAYYLIGLKEVEQIGLRVFIETIKNNRLSYLLNVTTGSFKSLNVDSELLFFKISTEKTQNRKKDIIYTEDSSIEKIYLGYGYYNYNFKNSKNPLNRLYLEPVFWRPGIKFFNTWAYLTPPTILKWLLVILSLLMIFYHKFKFKKEDFKLFIALGALSTAIFILGTNLIFEFRWKELTAIEPLLSIWTAISIAQIKNALSITKKN
jgi:hypothetical protein